MEKTLVAKVLEMAAGNGYQAYAVKDHDGFGYLITPSDNVITVNKGNFGGVTFTFCYVPSREHGSGCSCNDDAVYECDAQMLKVFEAAGFKFARDLGAKLYANSKAWYEKCYWKDSLVEVSGS